MLTLNNQQSKFIGFLRSIRKGFLLAYSLFILVTEVFGYLLDNKVSLGLLRWISLLGSSTQLANGYFVDDAFLTIQEDPQLVSLTMAYLNTFCWLLAPLCNGGKPPATDKMFTLPQIG